MSVSTTSNAERRFWIVVAFSIVAIAAISFSVAEMAGYLDAPCNDYSSAADNEQISGHITAPSMPEPDGASAHHRQATEECDEPDWWGLAPEPWLALLTLLLVIGTVALAAATFALVGDTRRSAVASLKAARIAINDGRRATAEQLAVANRTASAAQASAAAAEKSAVSSTASSRAYVLPVLHPGSLPEIIDYLDKMIDWESDHIGSVTLKFALRNFGQTPGVILELRAGLFMGEKPQTIREHFPANPVLGRSEGTEDFEVFMEVHPSEAGWLRMPIDLPKGEDAPADGFTFEGFVYFQDVFGRARTEMFKWQYHRRYARMMPVLFPRAIRIE